jgi:predicted phosphatase
MKTFCQSQPERCEPRKIKLVAWDADDTMWHIDGGAIATNIHGPFKLVDPDTLEAEVSYGGQSYYSTESKPKPTHKETQPKKDKPNIEDWWKSNIGPVKDDGVKDISKQLVDSLSDKEKEVLSKIGKTTGKDVGLTPNKPDARINLADLRGWSDVQRKGVDRLKNLYGQRGCYIENANQATGEITIDCKGDEWLLKKDGTLIERHPQEYTDWTPGYTYTPVSSSGVRHIVIKLLPTFRQTLDELEKRGIKSTIISLNSPGTVKAIVKAFGLADKFVEINDTWNNKGQEFDDTAKRQKLCPCDMMFVDNTISHTKDVAAKCGLSLLIGTDGDVKKPIEILNYIKVKE